MKVAEIVRRVRAAIDELMQNDSDFLRVSSDEANLTDTIIDKIGYALQHVIENAPPERLDGDAFETLTDEETRDGFSIRAVDGDLVATVRLPDDLLRIVGARLSSWPQSPVPEPDTSQVCLMQQDRYARGSWDRPVSILTRRGAGRYLEMYCAKTASDTPSLTFIRRPDTESIRAGGNDAEVSVPSQLEASLVYQVAGLTMVAFRDDIASTLFSIAQQYLDPDGVNGNKMLTRT